VWIELPVRLDLGKSFLAQQLRELPVHQLDTLLQLRLLVLLRGLERPPEVVEHGEELLDEPLVRTRGEVGLVARRPLAVVLELRGDALQLVQVFVALGCEGLEPLLETLLRLLRRGLTLVRHYERLASSSSMTS
jgi:hypothetical protein